MSFRRVGRRASRLLLRRHYARLWCCCPVSREVASERLPCGTGRSTRVISGRTTLIAHLGYPTESFKAPMIYNPYFEKAGIDAVVVPMGVTASDYPSFIRELFNVTNIRGALGDDAAQEDDNRSRRRGEPDGPHCRRGQCLAEKGGRNTSRRHVRRRGIRPWRPPQGPHPESRERTGRRVRWRRVGDCSVAGRCGSESDGPVRRHGGVGQVSRKPVVHALPRPGRDHRVRRPHRLSTWSSTPPHSG